MANKVLLENAEKKIIEVKKKPKTKPTVKQILYHGSTDAEEKLILIALREHSNPKGVSKKSYEDLVKLTGLSEGTVKNRLLGLRAAGRNLLELVNQQNKKPQEKNAYKIHMYKFLQDVKTPPIDIDKNHPAAKYAEDISQQPVKPIT